jgi:hypothetical protein
LQLDARQALPKATRNDQDVVGTVVADRDALILAEIPADLVRLRRLAAIQRRPQRLWSDAFGLRCGEERVNELLSLERLGSWAAASSARLAASSARDIYGS